MWWHIPYDPWWLYAKSVHMDEGRNVRGHFCTGPCPQASVFYDGPGRLQRRSHIHLQNVAQKAFIYLCSLHLQFYFELT
jgi:hypothetical protein